LSKVTGERPITSVELLDGGFVLFRDETGRFGLLDYDCPRRGADLAFGRALFYRSARHPICRMNVRCLVMVGAGIGHDQMQHCPEVDQYGSKGGIAERRKNLLATV